MVGADEGVLVYTLFADRAEAKTVAGAILELRLAACVNLLPPVESLFWWDGKLTTAQEVPALFKTTPHLAARLMAEIVARHSYETPAVLIFDRLATTSGFAAWLGQVTQPPSLL